MAMIRSVVYTPACLGWSPVHLQTVIPHQTAFRCIFRVLGREPRKAEAGRRPMAQKLFVGGLSVSAANDRLRELFAEVGAVESAVVVTDRDTGRSRGFGFVEMATPEEAEQAVQRYNGKEVDGRQLKVELAKSLDRN